MTFHDYRSGDEASARHFARLAAEAEGFWEDGPSAADYYDEPLTPRAEAEDEDDPGSLLAAVRAAVSA